MKSSDGLMVLKLSIFVGNAEMTDLFKCEKSKTTCCSPKSAIKEEKIKQERIKYQIRRKDTDINKIEYNQVGIYKIKNFWSFRKIFYFELQKFGHNKASQELRTTVFEMSKP